MKKFIHFIHIHIKIETKERIYNSSFKAVLFLILLYLLNYHSSSSRVILWLSSSGLLTKNYIQGNKLIHYLLNHTYIQYLFWTIYRKSYTIFIKLNYIIKSTKCILSSFKRAFLNLSGYVHQHIQYYIFCLFDYSTNIHYHYRSCK